MQKRTTAKASLANFVKLEIVTNQQLKVKGFVGCIFQQANPNIMKDKNFNVCGFFMNRAMGIRAKNYRGYFSIRLFRKRCEKSNH